MRGERFMTDILRKKESGRQKGIWKKIVPVMLLVIALFGVKFAGGHERKEDGASGERVADRIAEQAGQEVEAVDLQRNRSEEQTDRSADSGIGNIGQYGLRSRLLAAQEQAFYEMPDEAGILQRSPADKNVRETAEEEAASRAEKYKMTPQATEIPGNREAFR